jgi:hypothetical protein
MLAERKEILNEDKSLGYIESVFESDNVLKTTYFPNNQRLYIAFNRGETYSYSNVTPEMYKEFEEAESQGKWFFKRINKNPRHPYRKEFTLYPNEVKELKEIVEAKKLSQIEKDQIDKIMKNENE